MGIRSLRVDGGSNDLRRIRDAVAGHQMVQAPGLPLQPSTGSLSPDPQLSASIPAVIPAPPRLDSGQFWAAIGGGDEMSQSFGTLDALVRSTDVAVVGEVTDFREGRTINFPETGETMYLAEVRVRVEQTLGGKVISPAAEPGIVVVETAFLGFSPDPSRLAEVKASAPIGSRVILFLVNNEADADRHGSPADAPYRGEGFVYSLPHGVQAVIRDESGTARIGIGADEVSWLTSFDGRSFDLVARDIKTAASAVP